MRYAQILDNKAHWIFESDETIEQLCRRFSPDIVFVDITDKAEVQNGWNYHQGEFTTNIHPIDLQEVNRQKIKQLNAEYEVQRTELLKNLTIANLVLNDSGLVNELVNELNLVNAEYNQKAEVILSE